MQAAWPSRYSVLSIFRFIRPNHCWIRIGKINVPQYSMDLNGCSQLFASTPLMMNYATSHFRKSSTNLGQGRAPNLQFSIGDLLDAGCTSKVIKFMSINATCPSHPHDVVSHGSNVSRHKNISHPRQHPKEFTRPLLATSMKGEPPRVEGDLAVGPRKRSLQIWTMKPIRYVWKDRH